MAQETVFTRGIYFEKRAGAPAYVICKLSFKVAEAILFLQQYENGGGYVNVDILESKGGKPYCKLNQYIPENKEPTTTPQITHNKPTSDPMSEVEYPQDDISSEDIPF